MKRRTFSLRTRLVAVAVAIVTLGLLGTGVATYLTLRAYLVSRLDGDLHDSMASVLAFIDPDRQPPPGSGFLPNRRLVRGTEAALVEPSGLTVQLRQSTDDPGLQLTAAQLSTLQDADGPLWLDIPSGSVRVAVERLDEPVISVPTFGGRQSVAVTDGTILVVALPGTDLHATLTRLVGLELIIGAIVVASAAALAGLGVRIGLRPLDRVTRTAREVAEELSPDGSGLDKRVPVSDPHTEVGQLAVAVNTMLDTVETEYGARYESEQRMRRFLADASHELRTPLTSLRGYAELIRLRDKESADPDSRDALRRIEAEGTRMSRLVDDLLTLARHDRGAVPEWEPVDLTAVVGDAVAGVHAAHPERPITLTDPGEPTVVLGDRDQLLQVVRNVLTNAAIHTADGPITAAVQVSGPQAVVTVRDTGPGLPPEQAAQVFDRFWRAESGRTRARGGSGLGMSIVSALLTAHGGRVTFDSTVEAGTTVTIRLPVAARQSVPPPPTAPERLNVP